MREERSRVPCRLPSTGWSSRSPQTLDRQIPVQGGGALFATISGMGKSGTAATEDADGLVPGAIAELHCLVPRTERRCQLGSCWASPCHLLEAS